jgi:hypothetical protein
MPGKPPKSRLPDNFASFEASGAATGRRRRRATWSLRPMHEPSGGAAVDAARFVREAELCAGLGRRKAGVDAMAQPKLKSIGSPTPS